MALNERAFRTRSTRQNRRRDLERPPEREAGDLLALEALDQTGLAVNSSGAFLRYLEVSPPNPLIMGEREREQLAAALRRLISRLRTGQWLQFYVETRPLQLGRLLERLRGEVRAFAGEPPSNTSATPDRLALSRWRLYAAMEDSLRGHADEQAAAQQRVIVVVPTLPRPNRCASGSSSCPGGPGCFRHRLTATWRPTAGRRGNRWRTRTRSGRSSRRPGCRPGCSTARRSPRCSGGGLTQPAPTRGEGVWGSSRSLASSTPPPRPWRPGRSRCGCATGSPARRSTSPPRAITH